MERDAFGGDPEEDLRLLAGRFAEDAVFRVRRVENEDGKLVCAAAFLDGMTDGLLTAQSVVGPLAAAAAAGRAATAKTLRTVVSNCELSRAKTGEELARSVMSGDTAVFVPGGAFAAGTKKWPKRGVSEPRGETVVRGPREGFLENALDNVSMVRRRLKTGDLRVEELSFGAATGTRVYLLSLRGRADERVRCELKRRLAGAPQREVLDSNVLAEQIRDHGFSPFKTVGVTERPDAVAAKLLEGRVALLCDGSPAALTVPYLFLESLQTGEDYYTGYLYASFSRLLRFAGFALSVLVPALYVAAVNYHQELLPTALLLSVSKSRQGVPFPTVLELLLLLGAFDVLREASLRSPGSVGQALSVVGTLIIGQAAVEAKFVSAPVVIIVALAGTTSMLATAVTGALIAARTALIVLTALF
ncbi:MAG: spore germination protein, partial [Oscillospiraceae bacterium]|nr:spore germination protein [Oscillospiraceae bacterium]